MERGTLLLRLRIGIIACKSYICKTIGEGARRLIKILLIPGSVGKMRCMIQARNLRNTWHVPCVEIIVSCLFLSLIF